jgi:hypothetical protein
VKTPMEMNRHNLKSSLRIELNSRKEILVDLRQKNGGEVG